MSISPPILTSLLTLRHFVPEDVPKVFRMSQEPGMRLWIPDQVYEHEQAARDVLQYLISQYNAPSIPACLPYVLGVCLRTTSELIGHVGLSLLRDQVEIGFAIESSHQGRGLASEAVAAMSEWGIRRFELPLILGIAAADNIASCRVLEHAGFVLVDESRGLLHGKSRVVKTYHKKLDFSARIFYL